MIKYEIECETQHGTYRDALYLPEGHSFTSEQIEAMKQERVDNWVDLITSMMQASENEEQPAGE